MDLAYIFLAEAAAAGDGKFFAFGGGVHYLHTPGFPTTLSSIAVVVGVHLLPEEIHPDHRVELRGISPNGEAFFRESTTPLPAAPIPGRLDLPLLSIVVFNFRGLQLSSPGTYTFVLSVDSRELGRVSFSCHIAPPAEQNPANLSE